MSPVPYAFIAQPPRSLASRLLRGATFTSMVVAAAASVVYPSIAHVYRPTVHVDLRTGRCLKVVNHMPADHANCLDYLSTGRDAVNAKFNVVHDFDSGSIVK